MNGRCRPVALCAALAALLAGVGSARADLIVGSVIDVKFVGGGSLTESMHLPSYANPATFNSFSVGPYVLQAPTPGPSSFWMCFDVSQTVSSGQAWKALVQDVGGAAALYLHGGPTALDKMEMISWLSTQWSGATPTTLANINKAAWEITADYNGNKNSLNVDGAAAGARGGFYLQAGDTDIAQTNSLLAQAYDHRADDGGLYLIPVDFDQQGQRYVVRNGIQPFFQPHAVPEPGALFLLGVGFSGLCAARRGARMHRRSRSLAASCQPGSRSSR